MIRGIFWRCLLLSVGVVGSATFVAAVSVAPPFSTDRQLLWVAFAITAVLAPLLALGVTLLVRRGQVDELGSLEASGRLVRVLELEVALSGDRERVLREALDHLSDALLLLDGDRRILLANEPATRLLRNTSLEGLLLLEALRAPGLRELVDAGTGSLELDSEDQRPQVLVRARRFEGDRVLLVLQDVEELRRLERVRQDFVANVSHELRTPVSAVKANVETLLGGALEDPEAARTFAAAIARNASRLEHLVEDLLDLARLENRAERAPPERVLLRPLCLEVMDGLAQAAQAREVEVQIEVPDDLAVESDSRALFQIIRNLVDNAILHGRHGGQVQIEAGEEGGRVEVRVLDDGPGIEQRHRDRIFERFYRVDPGRSRAAGGTGLGLSIVRNLAASLGGSVRHEARSSRGSCFRVLLPRDGGR